MKYKLSGGPYDGYCAHLKNPTVKYICYEGVLYGRALGSGPDEDTVWFDIMEYKDRVQQVFIVNVED